MVFLTFVFTQGGPEPLTSFHYTRIEILCLLNVCTCLVLLKVASQKLFSTNSHILFSKKTLNT